MLAAAGLHFMRTCSRGACASKSARRFVAARCSGSSAIQETAQPPHLHFHLADANSPLESEGLPYVLESFEQLAATNMWERRQSELPLQNARVRFPVGDATSIDQSTRIAFVGSV